MASSQGRARDLWPLAVALIALALSVATILALALPRTGGRLVYALDDPYIHMAMARNWVEHGAAGVDASGFSSSSSSLLWLALLSAVYAAVGPGETSPLVLNLVAAAGLLCLGHAVLRRCGISGGWRCAGLLAVVFVMPLPPLVFAGQEHVLHAVLTVAFAYTAASCIERGRAPQPEWSRSEKLLCLLAVLLPMARFEGLFAVAVAYLLLAARGRVFLAHVMAFLALVPVNAFGLFSMSHGWWFLPNSVLLKGNVPKVASAFDLLQFLSQLGYQAYLQLATDAALLVLTIVALLLAATRLTRGEPPWERSLSFGLLFLGTTLLHGQFARLGWFRYQSYLVAWGVLVLVSGAPLWREIGSMVRRRWPVWGRVAASVVCVHLLYPLAYRGAVSLAQTPRAMTNIYEQQVQLGRFARRFYAGRPFAANDIGALSYLGEVRLLDLMGLAEMEVAAARRSNRFDAAFLGRVVAERGVRVAAIYDRWFASTGGIPASWVRVGDWTIRNNVVCGDATVAFYATEPSEVEPLRRNLRAFAEELPPTVMQREFEAR